MSDGIVCFADPKRKSHSGGFTFPPMEAELTADDVKKYKLGPALKRFGEAIAKQMAGDTFRDSGSVVVGVKLHSVNFTMVLDKSQEGDK